MVALGDTDERRRAAPVGRRARHDRRRRGRGPPARAPLRARDARRADRQGPGTAGLRVAARPRSSTSGRAAAPTPLVGREPEVARLRAGGRRAREGPRPGRCSCSARRASARRALLGELQTIAGDRVLWLEGHCRSYGGELLYWPFVEMLRALARRRGGRGRGRRSGRSCARSSPRCRRSTRRRSCRGSARLLAVRAESQDAQRRAGGERRGELRGAYCEWVEALCAQRPSCSRSTTCTGPTPPRASSRRRCSR